MTLMKINPINSTSIDRFFDDFFNRSLSDIVGSDFTISHPSVNIIEEENYYLIEFAAPGMEKKDFDVKIEDGRLMVSAELKSEQEDQKGKYRRKEFNYSSFKRSFKIPENVDTDSIDAKYKNGILSIQLNKREEANEDSSIVIDIQ